MNKLTSTKYIITILLFLFSFKGNSQQVDLKNAAKEIIEAANTCALITLNEQGHARVRTMEILPPNKDFIMWLGTNPKSRKVSDIRNNPNVTLYYVDHDDSGYVTLYGKAELVNDTAAKNLHWKEEWSAFYPNKEADFILIKVTPQRMEIVSNPRGIIGDSITWSPESFSLEEKKAQN